MINYRYKSGSEAKGKFFEHIYKLRNGRFN